MFARELGEAQYAIGKLEGAQSKLKNASHLISPLIAREAEVSSKIEGTQSSTSDIYIYGAGGKPEHKDTPVVSNYRYAMNMAINNIQHGQKLSEHLIKMTHGILLKDVRHKGLIGAYRNGDVWIAEKENDPIEKALYIPPGHIHAPSYMENILEYMENDVELLLLKTALIHYQFEAVHPFEDGNGRIGRLLIPLILYYKREISLPIIYISGYFDDNSDAYRHHLREVDKTGQYEGWVKYYLTAVKTQSDETLRLVETIYQLNIELKAKYETSKSPYLGRLIDYLFESPVFTIPRVTEALGLSGRLTATRLIDQLVKDGVLEEIEARRGAGGTKLFAYFKLLATLS